MTGSPVGARGIVVGGEPLTREECEVAALQEARACFEHYFTGAMKARNWLPWDDLPVAEIRERGQLLGEDTITILQGVLGLEDAANDIVADALVLIHGRRALRNLYLAWGMEESKHAEAWELVLIESGLRTADELLEYREAVTATRWHLRDDYPALATPVGLICHGLVQEQANCATYGRLRQHIRREYDLPDELTGLERERGTEVGAAAACAIVAADELAHRDVFLELVRIYRRVCPAETLAALRVFLADFHQPGQLPSADRAQLAEALERTGIATRATWVTDVQQPILAALGLVDLASLDAAAR